MSQVSERSSRSKAIPFKVLSSREEDERNSLNDLLSEVNEVKLSEVESELREYLKRLKKSHSDFRKASLDLSAWYDRNASHSSVVEVDDDRHQIQQEYKLSYSKLNNRLQELGFARCSSISEYSSCGKSVNQRVDEWVNKVPSETSQRVVET